MKVSLRGEEAGNHRGKQEEHGDKRCGGLRNNFSIKDSL